jgi:hypothetical protein
MNNQQLARNLERIAELLELRDENPHRVRAYRKAARSVRGDEGRLAERFQEGGEDSLKELPGIGQGIAGVIGELLRSGRSRLLRDLEADLDPLSLFSRIPGISDTLARRVVDELGVRSLEELEQAAHDGRLLKVEGFGSKRVQGVREVLAARLSRGGTASAPSQGDGAPPVALLLAVDERYRTQAERGELRRIAPRRFNPQGEAWLPILETEADGWEFTVLFSNTAQAHEKGKTRDWVVIYYGSDGREGQCTVVTAPTGSLEGRRIVRGREAECRRYYEQHEEEESK